jgi:hypothetical protein
MKTAAQIVDEGPETAIEQQMQQGEGPKHKIVLFHNRRRKLEKHPHLFGSLTMEGKEYKVAMWDTKSKNGQLSYYHGIVREVLPL